VACREIFDIIRREIIFINNEGARNDKRGQLGKQKVPNRNQTAPINNVPQSTKSPAEPLKHNFLQLTTSGVKAVNFDGSTVAASWVAR
jgi:hypothetical protein